ncbi:threonine-phosphate decarboxylase [Haloarchaeobius sp. HME9146]|uniref:threonine-phosphate decarboxylase n=1 Tax=Haloarchaeobius sp. HME9146 TaxID=2978732 RepID=UPI0021BEC6C7|nr:threonine-phosphate decarboxylase [Haloarchaeobius sp. HME9146]MCT9095636.1 pyridoxal phosphate-dependent class II aminotransferase [Haloarchaeobius sp. HME9146]
MHPDSVREAERVPHGGTTDRSVLDLSANTNPETPPGTEAVYTAALAEADRYPDDRYDEFRAAAAGFVGCRPEQVVPTPGGLAAIRLAIQTTVRPGDSVVVPYPSFGEYAREVRLQGADPVFVPHDEVLATDPADHAMVVACTPNNPTGECPPRDDLVALADRCADSGARLLADEAFLGYTDQSSLVGHDGVIVARSLTKLFGLPGLRAGYAVATGADRDALDTARRAWNLGTPAAAVGAHCLRQTQFVASTRETVGRERARLRDALEPHFEVAPSDAPFLLLDCRDRDVDALLDRARDAGVVLRDARTFRGLESHVRIAVKDRDATDQALAALGVEA